MVPSYPSKVLCIVTGYTVFLHKETRERLSKTCHLYLCHCAFNLNKKFLLIWSSGTKRPCPRMWIRKHKRSDHVETSFSYQTPRWCANRKKWRRCSKKWAKQGNYLLEVAGSCKQFSERARYYDRVKSDGSWRDRRVGRRRQVAESRGTQWKRFDRPNNAAHRFIKLTSLSHTSPHNFFLSHSKALFFYDWRYLHRLQKLSVWYPSSFSSIHNTSNMAPAIGIDLGTTYSCVGFVQALPSCLRSFTDSFLQYLPWWPHWDYRQRSG